MPEMTRISVMAVTLVQTDRLYADTRPRQFVPGRGLGNDRERNHLRNYAGSGYTFSARSYTSH